METIIKSIEFVRGQLTLETGRLAPQATAAVLGRFGDTMVLATIVEGKERTDIDYFPLTVEYVERLYAGGKIKGSRWVKREGRPSDEAILTARLIDRSIRPLFPKGYKKEVQVVVTVLSVDGENPPDVLSLIAVSAALSISPIPWQGPVAAVRVGLVKEQDNGAFEFIINPHTEELNLSDLDLVVSQTADKTVMIEAEGREVSEDKILEAIKRASIENKKIIDLINDFAKDLKVEKREVEKDEIFAALVLEIKKKYQKELKTEIRILARKEGGGPGGLQKLVEEIFTDKEKEKQVLEKSFILKAVEKALHEVVREQILEKKERPDGRGIEEIRPISCAVSVLPRTHGSAIFERGESQTLTVVTLGAPSLGQLIESASGEETKRYMHHYSMPPYSVGETGRIGYPSRREIGHGALAEKALLPVIPSEEKFPYTIRIVSEIMSSNGSTSMAAVCGSTLSLMDAGVPITSPVAGIAMGLVSKNEDHVVLTDIAGLEDFAGFMDFKIAGTEKGVTAIQLDVKNDGINDEVVKESLEKGKIARLFILEKMQATLKTARASISPFAPKIEVIHIETEKIGEIIGPGGKMIRNIIAQTGATVDVEDDGSVTITGVDEEKVKKAVEWVKGLTTAVLPGQMFEGEVKRILPFGAFVEITPGREGMVHVSKMAERFVKDPEEIVKIGDKVKVKVVEVDERGRINLTMLLNATPDSRPLRSPGRPFDRSRPISRTGPRFKRPRF